jgi:hypothetical protein
VSRDAAPRALLAALVAFVFTIAALAGCGSGDDDDDDDDAPVADAAPGGGDQPDALPGGGVGGQPDAAPGGGGGGSPFFRLTCSPDPAPADGGPDGGPDAGPPEEQSCCDPDGVCPDGFECLTGAAADSPHRCSPRCDDQGACAAGSACADFGGVAVCIPAAREGEPCAPELCDATGICVGASADDATCHRRCVDTSECEAPQTCQQLIGSPNKACL